MADSQYSAGDLSLSIQAISANAIRSLDAVISRLNLIDSKISKIGRLSSSGGTRSSLFSGKNIGNLPRSSRSSTYSRNSRSSRSSRSSIDSFLNTAKLTATIYVAKRLGGIVQNIAQSGADYTETLNLWRVAMGKDLIPQATEFVNKMNEAYGVSEKTLMNAQAIFKNMLGSLGQISEPTAYALSEGITQMALDYASLYNQTFDQAFTKFQAALAGQVRPIRSVAGYDITENTLFQLYQSLGGDKTMRQLSRTEKQLLAIYAIFQQMERSGAVGDLANTMESFANQSRVAKEQIQDIISYSGVLLTNWLEQANVMYYLNGILIFFGDVLKAAAEATGAIRTFDDPFASVTDSALDANEAVDELAGKLLGFDKFRSLNDSQESNMALDETLLNALQSYRSILSEASIKATEFADTLKNMSGLFNDDGTFNLDKWEDWLDNLENIAIVLGVIFGTKMILGIKKFFNVMLNITPILLIASGVSLLLNGIKEFVEGNYGTGLYYVAGAVLAIGAAIALLAGGWIPLLVAGIIAVGTAITGFIIDNLEWVQKLLNTVINKIIDGLNWLTGGLNDLWHFFGGEGEIGKIGYVNIGEVGTFADGGLPDKGSMFIAGESGAEYVYNMPNGQSGVANVQQIAQATYQGTMSALRDWWGGMDARGDIPQLREANATGLYQTVTGVAKSYGERWDKY